MECFRPSHLSLILKPRIWMQLLLVYFLSCWWKKLVWITCAGIDARWAFRSSFRCLCPPCGQWLLLFVQSLRSLKTEWVTMVALREWLVKYGWILAVCDMFVSVFSRVLWPKTFHSNQALSSGLNLEDCNLGHWIKNSTYRLRCERYDLMVWTGHLLKWGLENIFPSAWCSVPSRLPMSFLVESNAPGSSLLSSKYSPEAATAKQSTVFFCKTK